MRKKGEVRFSVVQALSWIVSSTLIISGSGHALFTFFFHQSDPTEKKAVPIITSLIQTGPQKEPLRSEYLAELMSLSKDLPQPASKFDLQKARQALLSSPLIKAADLKVIEPSTLYVDYTVRQPVAWIYDYENIGVDKEGFLIPMYPFFPPKNLPEIYLGLSEFAIEPLKRLWPKADWNAPLQGPVIDLAFDVMERLKLYGRDLFRVKRIDVSRAFDSNLGKREIVAVIENESEGSLSESIQCIHYLRLSSDRYPQELGNYLELRAQLLSADSIRTGLMSHEKQRGARETVVDLRLDQLAYVEEIDRV